MYYEYRSSGVHSFKTIQLIVEGKNVVDILFYCVSRCPKKARRHQKDGFFEKIIYVVEGESYATRCDDVSRQIRDHSVASRTHLL